jgi:hypothetical protein
MLKCEVSRFEGFVWIDAVRSLIETFSEQVILPQVNVSKCLCCDTYYRDGLFVLSDTAAAGLDMLPRIMRGLAYRSLSERLRCHIPCHNTLT